MAERKSDVANATQKTTVIEEGTQLSGTLTSDGRVMVKGKIEGDLRAVDLVVDAQGAVRGRINVGGLHSEGEIGGVIEAQTVRLSGSVLDGTVLRAKTLQVDIAPKDGDVRLTFGDCALEVGDDPGARADVAAPEAERVNGRPRATSQAPGPSE